MARRKSTPGHVQGGRVRGARVPPTEEGADVGLPQHTALHTGHGEVLAEGVTLLSRTDLQEADVLFAGLAAQPRSDVDFLRQAVLVQTDPPAEERLHSDVRLLPATPEIEIEERRAVQEEVAFLWKKQGKPREVHQPLIDFRLREVGIDGQVRPQARCHVVEEVDSHVGGAGERSRRLASA